MGDTWLSEATNMFELWDTVKGGEGKIQKVTDTDITSPSSVLMADFLQSEDTDFRDMEPPGKDSIQEIEGYDYITALP